MSTAASAAYGFVWPSRVQRIQSQLTSGDVLQRREGLRDVRDFYTESFEPLVRLALRDQDREIRHSAAEIAAQHRLSLATEVIPWLAESNPESRLIAVRLIERVPAPQAESALLRVGHDPELAVRREVTKALAHFWSEAATSALLMSLSDVDAEVRALGVAALAQRNEPRVPLAMVAAVNDTDDRVRAKAFLALGVFAEKQSESVLLLGLRDSSTLVRSSAVTALGMIPVFQQPTSVESDILKLIDDEQPLPVVIAAIRVLTQHPSVRVADALYARWAQLKRVAWRTSVAQWVGRSAPYANRLPELCLQNASAAVAESCLQLFGDATTNAAELAVAVRSGKVPKREALRVLAKTPDASLFDWVLESIESTDTGVVEAACQALGRLMAVKGAAHALDPLRLKLARTSRGSELRPMILRLIGQTRSPRAWAVLDASLADVKAPKAELIAGIEGVALIRHAGRGERLSALLSHTDRDVSRAAARELFGLADATALPALLTRREQGTTYREETVLGLSGLISRSRDGAALVRVTALLSSSVGAERDGLIEGLARNPDPRARTAVLALVTQGMSSDRAKLAESIVGGAESLDILKQLARDADGHVRANAAWSLGRVGGAQEIRVLETASNDERLDVRANALVALGRVAGRVGATAHRVLCRFSEDRVPGIREAALVGLTEAGEDCATDPLRARLLADPSERVRAAAARALRRGPTSELKPDDAFALRWCVAFESSDMVHAACDGPRTVSGAARAAGTLVFVSPGQVKPPRLAGVAVGLQRSDGMIRYTALDRRGALFEPDSPAGEGRLVLPIAIDR